MAPHNTPLTAEMLMKPLPPGFYAIDSPIALEGLKKHTIRALAPRKKDEYSVRIVPHEMLTLLNCQSVVTHGILWEGGPAAAISLKGGQGNSIQQCRFTGMGLGAICASGETALTINDCELDHCDNAGTVNPGGWINGTKPIDLWRCTNPKITQCRIHDMRGLAILAWGRTCNAVITRNVFERLALACPQDPWLHFPCADTAAIYIASSENGKGEQHDFDIFKNECRDTRAMFVYVDCDGPPWPSGIRVFGNGLTNVSVGFWMATRDSLWRGNVCTNVIKPVANVTPNAGNQVEEGN